MELPTLNGVTKTAEAIAKGPHRWNEATRKYEEISPLMSEYPRAMWHEVLGYQAAGSRFEQDKLEAEGWQTKPFPEKPVAKETVTTPSGDLALIVLQQQQIMQAQDQTLKAMQGKLDKLITEEPKRGPGRPKAHVETEA